MLLSIRLELPADIEAVHTVEELAFGQPDEADLVEKLRSNAAPMISLVAVLGGGVSGSSDAASLETNPNEQVVGHILFTPVTIQEEDQVHNAIGLGPLAVLPEYQRRGIGSMLVERGIETCRAAGHGIMVVLGHPWYYPKFGFVPARPLGIHWPGDISEEVFMVLELREGALDGVQGVAFYLPEFFDE